MVPGGTTCQTDRRQMMDLDDFDDDVFEEIVTGRD